MENNDWLMIVFAVIVVASFALLAYADWFDNEE